MRRFSEEDKETIWDMREAGVLVKKIARHLGRQNCSIRKFLAATGARRPSARDGGTGTAGLLAVPEGVLALGIATARGSRLRRVRERFT